MKHIFWKTNKFIIGLLCLLFGQNTTLLFAQNIVSDFYHIQEIINNPTVYGWENENIVFDTNGPGAFLDITIVTEPEHGTLNQNMQDDFIYNPNQDYVGLDSFALSVCFFPNNCDTLTVYITLINESDLPIANDDFLSVGLNSILFINPLENDVLEFSWYEIDILTDAQNGMVDINSGWDVISYIPNNGFLGQDSIQYELCQGGNCETAWIYLDVAASNLLDTCIAFIQNVVVAENGSYRLPEIDACFNFFNDFTFLQTPTNGNLVIEFSEQPAYLPNNNFVGLDTIIYQLQCDNSTCFEYTLLIEVLPESDLTIHAVPDIFFLDDDDNDEMLHVLNNDIFEDNDDLELTVITPPIFGIATISGSGNGIFYTLTEDPMGIGFDGLEYEICDENSGLCSSAFVLIILDNDLNLDNTCDNPDFCVYPGDANNDGFVDMLDLLTLGYNFDEIGIPRPLTSTDWTPQTSLDWGIDNIAIVASDEIEDSLEIRLQDAKYADCDGNGIVATNDIDVIDQNYALLAGKDESDMDSTDALIWVDLPDVVETNTWITADVYLGTVEQPVDSIYGLSFSLEFSSNTIDPSSLNATIEINDWVDIPNDNGISLVKPLPETSRIDVGITRINLQNEIEFQGKVSRVNLFVIDDVDGKNEDLALEVNISNAVLTTSQGEAKVPNTTNDVAEIITSIGETDNDNEQGENSTSQMLIFPNPSYHTLTIKSPQAMEQIHLLNNNGQLVYQNKQVTGKQWQLNVAHLPTGLYFVVIQGEEYSYYDKVQIIE